MDLYRLRSTNPCLLIQCYSPLDGVWDVPVWRLATNNAAETGAFCAKVATYNNGIGDVEWTRHIEFHCEDRNIVGGASPDRARELSLSLASQVSGAFVNDGVIFSSERSDATRPLVLPEALTAGKAVIVAGPSVAASSNRWLNFTPYGFRFNQGPANQRYPLMIGGSCELGSYQVYYEAGDEWCPVARDWLHITNSAQGPISWIGPTAGSHQYVNYWILEELLEHLTMNGADFGHALLMATRSVYYAHPEAYEAVVTYAGIGAPWLSLHRATGDPADAPIAIATDLNVPEFRIVPNPTYRPHGVEIQLVGRPLSQWGGLVVGPDGRRLLEFSVRDADRFSWDLRDRAGNAVPSGVYFVRGSGNLAGQGARIIVVR